mmetsp:Transcript_39317/g.98926  ORF Transcript_39317/g.98926 Transcript_39317/m.98926 type:complete len:200 (+) Transcript_39317:2001-2600(+)
MALSSRVSGTRQHWCTNLVVGVTRTTTSTQMCASRTTSRCSCTPSATPRSMPASTTRLVPTGATSSAKLRSMRSASQRGMCGPSAATLAGTGVTEGALGRRPSRMTPVRFGVRRMPPSTRVTMTCASWAARSWKCHHRRQSPHQGLHRRDLLLRLQPGSLLPLIRSALRSFILMYVHCRGHDTPRLATLSLSVGIDSPP